MAKEPTVRKRRAQRKLDARKKAEMKKVRGEWCDAADNFDRGEHIDEGCFVDAGTFEIPLPSRGSGMCLQLCCGEAPQMVRMGR